MPPTQARSWFVSNYGFDDDPREGKQATSCVYCWMPRAPDTYTRRRKHLARDYPFRLSRLPWTISRIAHHITPQDGTATASWTLP